MLIPGKLLISPEHGGDLAIVSQRYGIALADWIDVSTGINPRAFPIDTIATEFFQRLPSDDDTLCNAAKNYCDAPALPIAAAGSQVFIQWLPLVKAQLAQRRCRVAVPSIGYSEHAFRWRWAGHEMIEYDPRVPERIEALLQEQKIDVLIVINAHNPLGLITTPATLLVWQERLEKNSGWLVVDEAFIDPTPEYSVVAHTQRAGLIVLRSLGKFFGLAGVRCGFAFSAQEILDPLKIAIGPWGVSGPARAVATAALSDHPWQHAMRLQLAGISKENAEILKSTPWIQDNEIMRHALFNTVELPSADALLIEQMLAHRGVRVRRIELDKNSSFLRFGLIDPAHEEAWFKYRAGLNFSYTEAALSR